MAATNVLQREIVYFDTFGTFHNLVLLLLLGKKGAESVL